MQEESSLRARYAAFPRSAWFCIGFIVLFVVVAVVHVAQGTYFTLPYLGGGIAGFALWPIAAYMLVGELELTSDELRGRRRVGLPFAIARRDIAYIERSGRRKSDTLGVRVTLRDGSLKTLVRVKPVDRIAQLVERFPIPR